MDYWSDVDLLLYVDGVIAMISFRANPINRVDWIRTISFKMRRVMRHVCACWVLSILPLIAMGCTQKNAVSSHFYSAIPNDHVQLFIGRWYASGPHVPGISLTYDGGMWVGGRQLDDLELVALVRRLSASPEGGEITVALLNPDKVTTSDFYTQLLKLREKVERGLASGGHMKIFIQI